MKFSSLLSRVQESATLEVARVALRLRREGADVVDLSAGQPDFASPTSAVAAARQALADGFTRYTPSSGIRELREALADKYRQGWGAPWEAEQVIVTVGAKAALLEALLALFEAGDEVLFPSPSWVSTPEQIRLAGARGVAVACSAEDGFRIHAQPILDAITPATRGILLNSPCNPTGGIILAEDLERIVAAAAELGIWVLSDETYERFLYGGQKHASVAALASRFPENLILIGSFSKTYAMTGWRLGYLLASAEAVHAVSKIQSHATSNPTSFAMVGAVEALRSAEAEVAEMIAEYAVRRDLTCDLLNAIPNVSCVPPDGAFYAFPRVDRCFGKGRQGSLEMATYLLEKAGVAVVPGAAFGDDRHLRISFAASREQLEEGVARLARALRS